MLLYLHTLLVRCNRVIGGYIISPCGPSVVGNGDFAASGVNVAHGRTGSFALVS